MPKKYCYYWLKEDGRMSVQVPAIYSINLYVQLSILQLNFYSIITYFHYNDLICLIYIEDSGTIHRFSCI